MKRILVFLASSTLIACGSSGGGKGGACEEVAGNACEDDLGILAEQIDTIVDASVACGLTCVGEDDPSQCSADCIAEEAGISECCGGCFGDLIACTLADCIGSCVDASSPECTSCIEDAGCNSGFEDCAGFSANIGDGACTADLTTLLDLVDTIVETTSTCGVGCAGDEDVSACTSACVVEETGISTGCGMCFGDLSECTLGMCLEDCINVESEDCAACQEAMGCNSGFEECAGFSPDLAPTS